MKNTGKEDNPFFNSRDTQTRGKKLIKPSFPADEECVNDIVGSQVVSVELAMYSFFLPRH